MSDLDCWLNSTPFWCNNHFCSSRNYKYIFFKLVKSSPTVHCIALYYYNANVMVSPLMLRKRYWYKRIIFMILRPLITSSSSIISVIVPSKLWQQADGLQTLSIIMMMSQDEDHSGVHVSTADCWPLRDGAVSCSLVLVLEVAALHCVLQCTCC